MGSQNFEQQVAFYHNVFVYCAIAALIFLFIAVLLFFLLKIPRVFGEMTGRDAKKAIDEMVEANASTGSLTSLKIGEDGRRRRRGRTGALSTGRLKKNTSVRSGGLGKSRITVPMAELPGLDRNLQNQGQNTQANDVDRFGSTPTEGLNNQGSTPTDVLDNSGSGRVYQQPLSETMVLNQDMRQGGDVFVVLRSIVEIHTDEVI